LARIEELENRITRQTELFSHEDSIVLRSLPEIVERFNARLTTLEASVILDVEDDKSSDKSTK
jgi:hypothetical protein